MIRIAIAAAVFAVLTPARLSAGQPTPLTPAVSHAQAARLYERACANCHGPDGRGASRALATFSDPLPDFQDCAFATREPDTDWLAVIHDGGPARAFGRMMPAFSGALTLEEMTMTLEHVRTFCRDRAWPRGELNLPRPLVTEKAFPEDEAVITTAVNTTGSGTVSSKLVYERRVGSRSQFEVVVPFSFLQQGGNEEWSGGIGDLTLGVKRAFAHSRERGSIVSAAAEIILPIGDDALGLSKGTAVFEPFVSMGQVLPRDAFVQAQAGVELPFDRNKATPEAFWRVAGGISLTQGMFGRAWSPMVEVVAARELESGQKTHFDFVPQMQVTLSTRQHIMGSIGVRVPVNHREGRHPQVLCYLLWDWFDGPLFGGW
ncbi:MAG TPA: cytochrome c [Vicinamibacterales bacterium]